MTEKLTSGSAAHRLPPDHEEDAEREIAPVTEPATAVRPEHLALREVLLHPQNQADRNHRNVLVDAVGVGIASGVSAFLSVFLVRLGAGSLLVGLLTAMPAVTGILLAMPIGEFLGRRLQIVPWFSRARLFALSCYAFTGLVPFFVHERAAEAIIVIWAAATIPQTIVQVSFTVVMGKVAGERGRFTLMSRRWSILGLTSALTVLAVGQLLAILPFPLNYQVVFIASAIGGLISYRFSGSIRLPPSEATPARRSLPGLLRAHGRELRQNPRFLNFVASQFVLRLGLTIAIPLLPIYYVRVVNASDAGISLINSVNTAAAMIAYYVWGRLLQRWSSRRILVLTTSALIFYPLAVSMTHSVGLLVVWAGLAGLFFAGLDLLQFDILLEACPAENQATYIGLYHTAVNLALFLAPLLASLVMESFGIGAALLLSVIVRAAGAGLTARLRVGAAAAA